MSVDESLFHYFFTKLKAKRGTANQERSRHWAHLDQHAHRLTLLASALWGAPIEIKSDFGLGGLIGSTLYLPSVMNHSQSFEENMGFYVYRTVFSITAAQCLELKPFESDVLSENSLKALRTEIPKVQSLMKAQYPTLPPPTVDQPFLFGPWPRAASKATEPTVEVQVPPHAVPKGSELEAKTRGRPKEQKLRKEAESPLVHVFEKVNTAEEYKGGSRAADGSDEIESHKDALDELHLDSFVRSAEPASSVLKTDSAIETQSHASMTSAEPAAPRVFHYPEWSEARRAYRQDWCTLLETKMQETNGVLAQEVKLSEREVREEKDLRLRLENIFNTPRWKNRELDGAELDLAAVVDRYAQAKAGGAQTDRIYSQKNISEKDLACLFLVDTSLSSDSWVAGVHVSETLKKALLTLSHALPGLFEKVAFDGFYSNTRHQCTYLQIKDFDEKWSRDVASRIQCLEPTGYTRIGVALRHATRRLEAVSAKNRLLVLLSDAKPTDYDHYEGHHGIQDVRRACLEARGKKVQLKVLTVSDKRSQHFQSMFGEGGFQYLVAPHQLGDKLYQILKQAVHIRR